MKNIFSILILFAVPSALSAQSLPPIFDSTPKDLLKAGVLVSFPKNTWLENMVQGSNEALFVTNYPEGKIYRVSTEGKAETFAQINGKIAGVANYTKGGLLVSGWDTTGKPALFFVSSKGETTKLLNIDGGMFPNGILHFYDKKYLIADSYAGCIWEYDGATNSIKLWIKDTLLERSSLNSQFPAANGLKLYKNYLYVSNTQKQILVKIPLNGTTAGKPEIFKDRVNIDDFAIDDAGDIYGATNVYNSVIKITPKKEVVVIADSSTGVAGSTAVLISSDKDGKTILYISTSGGMAVPPPGGVQEGKIIILYL